MPLLNKNIQVQRGLNIGKAIINSFPMYNKIEITSIDIVRNTINKTNDVALTYTYK